MSRLLFIIVLLCSVVSVEAQSFADHFADATLRIDYSFAGNAKSQAVYLDNLTRLPRWAGRRNHLSQLPLRGNGQLLVRDADTHNLIYVTSFSTLFQEWIATDEAVTVSRSFEVCLLIPFPLHPVEVEVRLFDKHDVCVHSFTHSVRPDDILIRRCGDSNLCQHKYISKASSDNAIDVAILAEGYDMSQRDLFFDDARVAVQSILSHHPFDEFADRFNFLAVWTPSVDSGVSIPRLGQWRSTSFGSHFSTFYSDRYLTTLHVKSLHDALAGFDYEHIIVLANTPEYGGGGIYNNYTLTSSRDKFFQPVVVHEFGHSFGGLADEYYYTTEADTSTYSLDVEPWEPNITTLVDFDSKWSSMIPDAVIRHAPDSVLGIYEGGGYSGKGIYRASWDCRMKTNQYPEFCPVCREAIRRLVLFYTE